MTTASDQFKEFAELKSHLSQCKNANGDSLYTHVSDILQHIVVHCPGDALNKFEEISYLIKNKKEKQIEEWL